MTKKEMKKKFMERIENLHKDHIHYWSEAFNTLENDEQHRAVSRRCAISAKEQITAYIKIMFVDFKLINKKEMSELSHLYI